MKTYKQKYQQIWNDYYKTVKELANAKAEGTVYKLAIEKQELFDPVEYSKMKKNLAICVDALKCIKQVSQSDTMVNIIAKEALYQIGESETW